MSAESQRHTSNARMACTLGVLLLGACRTIEPPHVAATSHPPVTRPPPARSPPPGPTRAWGVEDPAIVRLAAQVVDAVPADEPRANLACFVQGPPEPEYGALLPNDYPDIDAMFNVGGTYEVVQAFEQDAYETHVVVRDVALKEGEDLTVVLSDVDALSENDIIAYVNGIGSRVHPFVFEGSATTSRSVQHWRVTCRFLPHAAVQAAVNDLVERLRAALDAEFERLGGTAGDDRIDPHVDDMRFTLMCIVGRKAPELAPIDHQLDRCASRLEKRKYSPRLARESGWVVRDEMAWRATLECQRGPCQVVIEHANFGPSVDLSCAEPLFIGGKHRAYATFKPHGFAAGQHQTTDNDVPPALAQAPDLRVHLECARGKDKLVLDLPVQR